MKINMVGLFCFLLALYCVPTLSKEVDLPTSGLIIVCAAYALPILILEFFILKPYKNTLDFSLENPKGNWPRVRIKLIGFYACIAFVALIYWLFPEYKNEMYHGYYGVIENILLVWMVLSIYYFYFIDTYSKEPKDQYYYFGMILMGKGKLEHIPMASQLLLGWLVKLFFLPLMFSYLGGNLADFTSRDLDFASMDFNDFYELSTSIMFTVDLALAVMGYALTFKIFDSHIRSTEPTFLGWFIAIVCYQPFWRYIGENYINHDQPPEWDQVFMQHELLYITWGIMIITLYGIFVWSTAAFGARFSNLTNRGIITNGPYRYTKHPAYLSKNVVWWLMGLPFIADAGILEGIRASILLAMLNFIYFMRARTEERHLSYDPDYVAYAAYIEKHGLFRFVGSYLPFLKFKKGHLFNLTFKMDLNIYFDKNKI